MSTNRPFLSNFLAAFRAQSTFSTQQSSSSISPSTISQNARAIASKASQSGPSSAPTTQSTSQQPQTQSTPAQTQPAQQQSTTHTTHYHAESSSHSTATSTPIPINGVSQHRRRGSDSSTGSDGFRDALGPEKWYIGGRNHGGEEQFYRLGMVTKVGGRYGGGTRVGSFDQLSL